MDLDYDINSYSINEIYEILGTTQESSLAYIKNICEDKKELAKKLDGEERENFINFINDCYTVLKSLKTKQPEYKIDLEKDNFIQLVNERNECNYKVNPITPSTIKQIISIDSLFRDNYETSSSSNFVFTLPNEIVNVTSMKLTATEIPNTYYLISKKRENNKFKIRIKDNSVVPSVETDFEIELPEGTWGSGDFIMYIQNYFDVNNSTDLRYLYLTLDDQTGRILFRFKTPDEITNLNTLYGYTLSTTRPQDLEYKFLNIDKNTCFEDYNSNNYLLYIVGFSYDQLDVYISFSNTLVYGRTTFNGFIIANFVYAHTIMTFFYVCIDDYITNTKDQVMAFKRDGMIAENILGRVQIKNAPFTINVDNNTDNVFKERNYFGNVKIRKLGIRIIDKYGSLVDLNNSEMSLALELTQSYCSERQNNYNKLLMK